MGGGVKEKMIWGRENSHHSRKKRNKGQLEHLWPSMDARSAQDANGV